MDAALFLCATDGTGATLALGAAGVSGAFGPREPHLLRVAWVPLVAQLLLLSWVPLVSQVPLLP